MEFALSSVIELHPQTGYPPGVSGAMDDSPGSTGPGTSQWSTSSYSASVELILAQNLPLPKVKKTTIRKFYNRPTSLV